MITLPPDALEELARLIVDNDHADPMSAWMSGQPNTAFRRQMWPYDDRDDDRFRVIVPVSGGLDSATCYMMAKVAGLPVEPVMIATGVDYARWDADAARTLTEGTLTVLDLPATTWHTTKDVQIGRNSAIIWRLLQHAAAHNWWGEVWFGHLGGNYLETPIVGGDKSYRWVSTMQHLATAYGYDIRISSPLIGMSKSDCVTWWASRGMVEQALATRSCFLDVPHQCGRCWACLMRYLAFAAAGYTAEVEATYPVGVDFAEVAREFWKRATWPVVTTRPTRMIEAMDILEHMGLGQEWALNLE